MRQILKLYATAILLVCCSLSAAMAQDHQADEDAAYVKVTNERAGKIVDKMDISNEKKARKVQDLIARQYRDLSKIQEERDAAIETLKKQSAGNDEAGTDARIKLEEEKAEKQITQLHDKYIKNLSATLTPAQVEQVKDGMTYSVLPLTYKAFTDMIPDLTEEQKKQIKDYLAEAREHAMDAGSSEKKHWWFGKYKGKINNYLSAEGYDLTEEREAWEKRLKAESNEGSK